MIRGVSDKRGRIYVRSSGEQSVKICMGGVDVLLCTGDDGFVRVWVCHVV